MTEALRAEAYGLISDAAILLRCSRDGHKGEMIASDDQKESYICAFCMKVYEVNK